MTTTIPVVALDWAPLRARRKRLNLSQRDVGAMVGVGPGTVCRWERGSRQVSALQLAQIARGLGTPGFELFRAIEDKPVR
jgi:transcriptional regulator with XRE-family HTH domain